ncbi:hypothetical protein KL938_003602 [Ogataea parapolymorpha]|nr:hypothetical protein KL938_003602 [Ogataea parapolymorpha]
MPRTQSESQFQSNSRVVIVVTLCFFTLLLILTLAVFWGVQIYSKLVLPLFPRSWSQASGTSHHRDLPPSYNETRLSDNPYIYPGIKPSYSIQELKLLRCYLDHRGRLCHVTVAQRIDPQTMKEYDEIQLSDDYLPDYSSDSLSLQAPTPCHNPESR